VKDICRMPLSVHGWSHPQSIRIMCLCSFQHLCHTWKYCRNLLLGIHCVTLVPCHDCFQAIQYYNVSRKFCQKSLCWRVCVGRCIVSIQNQLGTGIFGTLGKNTHLTIGFDVAITFSLLFTLLLASEILFLGAFPNCEKRLLASSCLSVCLSIRQSAWNNAAATGRILMQFDIWMFFEKYAEKIQVPWIYDKNNR